MVSWMAGMFYLVRLMVYHAEALPKPLPERDILCGQYKLMEWKVYRIIIVPAVLMTWSFGTMLLVIQPAWLTQSWMQVKLALLVLLSAYTHYTKGQIQALERGSMQYNHRFYRVLNEVPTLFLTAIVFLAVYKLGINYGYLLLGMTVFTAMIGYGLWSVSRRLP
jgi:putative membrane protein